MKKIRRGEDSGSEIYHTNEECPAYPESVRDVREDDERRGVRECEYCKDLRVEAIV
jgi:hypothetical protein